jgi:hypothetical protein
MIDPQITFYPIRDSLMTDAISISGRRLFIFTFAEYVAHNLCCQIRADDNLSTCTFTTGKLVYLFP